MSEKRFKPRAPKPELNVKKAMVFALISALSSVAAWELFKGGDKAKEGAQAEVQLSPEQIKELEELRESAAAILDTGTPKRKIETRKNSAPEKEITFKNFGIQKEDLTQFPGRDKEYIETEDGMRYPSPDHDNWTKIVEYGLAQEYQRLLDDLVIDIDNEMMHVYIQGNEDLDITIELDTKGEGERFGIRYDDGQRPEVLGSTALSIALDRENPSQLKDKLRTNLQETLIAYLINPSGNN